jgi:Domain of unknown function (DUF1942)
VKRFGVGAIAAAVLVMTGLVNPAHAAASEDCMRMHNFGSQQRLMDAGGAVVQEWTVADMRKSSDPAPGYPLAGQLWEATVAVQAISGAVTPIIPNFQARTAGGSYPALWQLASPQGISGATIAQGQKARGKVYFDVTGADPMVVTYTGGGAQPLMWCDCEAMMAMPMDAMMAMMPMGDCPHCMQG